MTTAKDTTTAPDGILDEQRHLFYNANWQLLQENIDADYLNNPGTNRIAQQIWGVRYIDDPLIRRIDRDADGRVFRW